MKRLVQLMEEVKNEKDQIQLKGFDLTISEVEKLIKKALKADEQTKSVTLLISKRIQQKFVSAVVEAGFNCIHKGDYPAPEVSGGSFILYEVHWRCPGRG
jgi:hypothetical protein